MQTYRFVDSLRSRFIISSVNMFHITWDLRISGSMSPAHCSSLFSFCKSFAHPCSNHSHRVKYDLILHRGINEWIKVWISLQSLPKKIKCSIVSQLIRSWSLTVNNRTIKIIWSNTLKFIFKTQIEKTNLGKYAIC